MDREQSENAAGKELVNEPHVFIEVGVEMKSATGLSGIAEQ